jgi:hypothetical protein
MSDPCRYQDVIPKLEVHMQTQTVVLQSLDKKMDGFRDFQVRTEERLISGVQTRDDIKKDIDNLEVDVKEVKDRTIGPKLFALIVSVSMFIGLAVMGLIANKISGGANEAIAIEKNFQD